jgi:hypothetical protein
MLEAPLPYLSFLCVNNPLPPSFDVGCSTLDVGIEKSFSVVSLLGGVEFSRSQLISYIFDFRGFQVFA